MVHLQSEKAFSSLGFVFVAPLDPVLVSGRDGLRGTPRPHNIASVRHDAHELDSKRIFTLASI